MKLANVQDVARLPDGSALHSEGLNGQHFENLARTAKDSRRGNRHSQDMSSGAFRLLSDKESARYLGVSRTTVREYEKRGILRRVLLPHPSGYGYIARMLFDVVDLDLFVERLKGKK